MHTFKIMKNLKLIIIGCWVVRTGWNLKKGHCIKSARIRSYSGPHFPRIFPHSDWIRRDTISPYSVQMRENAGKMRTKITPNTDTFYAVGLDWLDLGPSLQNQKNKELGIFTISDTNISPSFILILNRVQEKH